MALPGTGKTFDQFREDDVYCKQYANAQMGERRQIARRYSAAWELPPSVQLLALRQVGLSAGEPVLRLAPVVVSC